MWEGGAISLPGFPHFFFPSPLLPPCSFIFVLYLGGGATSVLAPKGRWLVRLFQKHETVVGPAATGGASTPRVMWRGMGRDRVTPWA